MNATPEKKKGCGCGSIILVSFALSVVITFCVPKHEATVEDLTEMLVKEELKNPASYERVSIRTFDRPAGGKGVIIDYRATNSFGAVVPGGQTFFFDAQKNRVDYEGRIIERFKN